MLQITQLLLTFALASTQIDALNPIRFRRHPIQVSELIARTVSNATSANIAIVPPRPLHQMLLPTANIITYPSISFFNTSTVFSVVANSVPISVPVIATYHTGTFAASAGAPVTITITFSKGPIALYSLLPAGPDVAGAIVSNNTLTFTVVAPRKLEVRINSAVTVIGDTVASTVMYLVVDLPEIASQIPSPTDPTVLYFAPGIHNLGLVQYNSTKLAPKKIYAAPGALINAAFRFTGTSNLTISGRGIFRNSFQDKSQTMMYWVASSNIIVRDVFLVDSPQHVVAISSGSVGNTISSRFLIDNIKSLHRGGNSDGFSLFGPTNNIVVQNVLLVNMDNQIVLQPGLPTGPFNNTFRNNIFVKPSSAGNFMAINPVPAIFGINNQINGTIGPNNLFTSFDILRLSGADGLVSFNQSNAINNIILDQMRITTFASRKGNTNLNYFLYLSSNNTQFKKSITIQNSAFPAWPTVGYAGSMIRGNWLVNVKNLTIGGVAVTNDDQIGLTAVGSRGVGVATSYSQAQGI